MIQQSGLSRAKKARDHGGRDAIVGVQCGCKGRTNGILRLVVGSRGIASGMCTREFKLPGNDVVEASEELGNSGRIIRGKARVEGLAGYLR